MSNTSCRAICMAPFRKRNVEINLTPKKRCCTSISSLYSDYCWSQSIKYPFQKLILTCSLTFWGWFSKSKINCSLFKGYQPKLCGWGEVLLTYIIWSCASNNIYFDFPSTQLGILPKVNFSKSWSLFAFSKEKKHY